MLNGFKIGAAACGAAYILCILFLPFLIMMGYSFSGAVLMPHIGWIYLPLAAGLAVLVCALACPGKIGGIVSIIGAFTALISFFIIRSEAGTIAVKAADQVICSGFSIGTGRLVGQFISVGAGVVLAIILAAGSAVLCFLSEANAQPKSRSAGLTADDGDEW